jgi:hypothetical protein
MPTAFQRRGGLGDDRREKPRDLAVIKIASTVAYQLRVSDLGCKT